MVQLISHIRTSKSDIRLIYFHLREGIPGAFITGIR